MAVYSMTGYASAATSINSLATHGERIAVEIRSVNSRFLDITFRLPDELRQTEPELRTLISSNIKRGKIEVRAALEAKAANLPILPSSSLLEQLKSIQKNVQVVLPEAGSLSVADVLRLASAPETSHENISETKKCLSSLIKLTMLDLLASREREGARLTLMLMSHLKQLRELVLRAGPLVPILVEQQRQKFMDRWKDAMTIGSSHDSAAFGTQNTQQQHQQAMDRALNEATAFAIRIDVAEELTRLASHLDEIDRILSKGGETGKKLDFLIQELHREANTLGAKSTILELTRISVEMKVLIEQMREQVQNIE